MTGIVGTAFGFDDLGDLPMTNETEDDDFFVNVDFVGRGRFFAKDLDGERVVDGKLGRLSFGSDGGSMGGR